MPIRREARSRVEQRRRELLRLLLEEEENGALSHTEAEALLHELRRERPALGELLSTEKMQGFMWGVGATALLLLLFPAAKERLRPFAVASLRGAMDLFDQVKSTLAEMGEGLQDLVAEAQFERVKGAAEPDGGQGA